MDFKGFQNLDIGKPRPKDKLMYLHRIQFVADAKDEVLLQLSFNIRRMF